MGLRESMQKLLDAAEAREKKIAAATKSDFEGELRELLDRYAGSKAVYKIDAILVEHVENSLNIFAVDMREKYRLDMSDKTTDV